MPTFCTKQAHEGCVKDFNCARRKTVNSCYCFQYFIIPARNSGRFTWVRLQQLQEQRYLLLPVCPVFRIFNVGKKMLPAITHGICAKIVRVCTENWEKNPLPRRGLEPVSVLRLAVPPSALPTVISPPLFAESATLNSVIRSSKQDDRVCMSVQARTSLLPLLLLLLLLYLHITDTMCCTKMPSDYY